MSTALVIPACLESLVREVQWLVWRREHGTGERTTKVLHRDGHGVGFGQNEGDRADRSSRGGDLPWR
jgi:hypothetical protein